MHIITGLHILCNNIVVYLTISTKYHCWMHSCKQIMQITEECLWNSLHETFCKKKRETKETISESISHLVVRDDELAQLASQDAPPIRQPYVTAGEQQPQGRTEVAGSSLQKADDEVLQARDGVNNVLSARCGEKRIEILQQLRTGRN